MKKLSLTPATTHQSVTVNLPPQRDPVRGTFRMNPLSRWLKRLIVCGLVGYAFLGLAINWSQARHDSGQVPILPTLIWSGEVDTNWHNPANWWNIEGGLHNEDIPNPDYIVDIPGGCPRYPATYTDHPVCKSLEIRSGGSMTLSGGYDLTVIRDITISGALSVAHSGSNISCSGNWTNHNVFNPGQASVYFTGTKPSLIAGNALTHFYNLNLNKEDATENLYPQTDFNVVNNLVITKGQLNLSPTTDVDPTINITGNLIIEGSPASEARLVMDEGDQINCHGLFLQPGTETITGGTIHLKGNSDVVFACTGTESVFTPAGGTVSFDGGGTPSYACASTVVFNNLTINNQTTLQPAQQPGFDHVLDINGNLLIESGSALDMTVDENSPSLKIAGNWTNYGTFLQGNCQVILDGATNAALRGNHTFDNLTIRKDLGSVVYCRGACTVKQTLCVEHGELEIPSNHTLIVQQEVQVNSGGRLDLEPDATLKLAHGAAVSINEGGEFEALGTSRTHRAKITSTNASARYSFVVAGTINAQYYQFDYLDANGLVLLENAWLNNLDGGSFNEPASNGTLITLKTRAPGALDSIYGCSFTRPDIIPTPVARLAPIPPAGKTLGGRGIFSRKGGTTSGSSSGSPDTSQMFNVTVLDSRTATVAFKDGSGNLYGESYDRDPYNRVNWPSTTRPSVTNVSPSDNQTQVGINTNIIVTFSKGVEPTTVNTSTVLLRNSKAGNFIPGTVTYDPTNDQAIFDSVTNLIPGQGYTVIVTTGIKDWTGQALVSGFTSTFQTGMGESHHITADNSPFVVSEDQIYEDLYIAEGGEFQTTEMLDLVVNNLVLDGKLTGNATIRANNFTIGATGEWYCDGNGYGPGQGPGKGGHGANTYQGGGGGGYGGKGGDGAGNLNSGGPVCGSEWYPRGERGSGGGNGGYPTDPGGSGGGAKIVIMIGQTFSFDGLITACGADGKPDYSNVTAGGGGAGGSVYIECATFAGNGTIRVNGGNGGSATYGGGGGGGGRVAIYYSTAYAFYGNIFCAGGAGVNPGQPGTIRYVKIEIPVGITPPSEDPTTSATQAIQGSFFTLNGNNTLSASIAYSIDGAYDPPFDVYYNTLDDVNNSPLGPGWTHSYNMKVISNTDGTLTHMMPCGKRIRYTDDDGDNVYESDAIYGDYSQIQDHLDNTYTLTKSDLTILSFTIPTPTAITVAYLTEMMDRNGNKNILDYDVDGKLTTITDPEARETILQYDGEHLFQVIDPASNQIDFIYEGDKLTHIQKAGDWNYAFTYHPDTNLLATRTDPEGNITQYEYNEEGKLIQIIDPDSRETNIAYDELMEQVYITDRTDMTTDFIYDKIRNVVPEYKDPAGNTTINTFDEDGNLLTQTKPLSGTTTYTYNALGNMLTMTDAQSCTTTYQYEDPDNPYSPTRIIDPLNVTTYMEYDASGNMTKRVEALGTEVEQTTTYEYYDNGQLKKEIRDPDDLILITDYFYTNNYLTKKVVDLSGLNITYEYDYDTLGNMIKSWDPNGNLTQYLYDARGNQTQITDPDGIITTMEYDQDDRLIRRIEDANNKQLTTEYYYDDNGNLTKTIIDPAGLNIITQHEYDAEGRETRTIDPEGAITEYEYYDNGLLKKQTIEPLTLNLVTLYYYDANGNQTLVIDPENHGISYTYTALDRLETVTDAEGNVTTYAYDAAGNTTDVTDARGNLTHTEYDELRRVKYVRTPEANITTAYVYDKAGRTVQVIGPWYDDSQNGIVDNGETADITYNEYDKADRLIRTYVNDHPATEYAYDKTGNQISVTDPVGVVTEYQYDKNNRLVLSIIDPNELNEQTKYVYDTVGNQIEVVMAHGTPLGTHTYSEYDNANRLIKSYTNYEVYATHYEYDQVGRQTKVIDAENHATQYFYDPGGRLIKVTNALNYNTEYAYDKVGNRTKVTYYRNSNPVETIYTYYMNNFLETVTYPGFGETPNTTTYVYDGNGNLTDKTDATDQTISYEYDKNNRLTTKTYPDASTVAYTYDAKSNLLTLVDDNTDTENVYDDLNRLTQVTDNKYSPAKVIQYTYYEDGLRESMTDPEDNLIEYTYDKAKRLKTVNKGSTIEATYNYNALGLRTGITRGNNAYTEYEYNHICYWLTALYNRKSDTTLISSFVYTHDLVSNRTSMTLANNDVVNYTYDAIYQLTNEVRTGATAYNISWTYDEVGNRVTQNKDGVITDYTYNDANQLTQEEVTGVSNITYQYDANGNQTQKSDGTDIWQWAYDYEDRQVTYNDPDDTKDTTYTYCAGGKRIKKDVNGTVEKYIYDGANIIIDLDGSDNVSATYVTPFLDQNLLVTRDSANYYYLQDGLGSVRNLLDSAEVIKNSYDYYAFGEVLSQTETIPNRYKFTAREWDKESQTYYYRARNNDPRIGRFLQRDPGGYKGGIGLYTYVGNNPVNSTDPSGLKWTTNDFWKHYRKPPPKKPIDIGAKEVDLLDDYKGAPAVKKVIQTVHSRIQAKTMTLTLQCVTSGVFPISGSKLISVGRRNPFNPLFSIGRHYLTYNTNCTYKGVWVKEPLGKYGLVKCKIKYEFKDSFEDPFSVGIEVGTPYPITGKWQEDFSWGWYIAK